MRGSRAFSVAGNSCVAKWMSSIGVNSADATFSSITKKSHLGYLHLASDRRSFASSSTVDSGSSVRMAVEALQEQLQKNASEKQQRLNRMRREDGSLAIGTITPQSVVGGMRGMTALLTETSVLDAGTGLKIHGHSMRDLILSKLPKMSPDHEYPSVESLLWLLMTGDIPNEQQVTLLQRALYELSLPASDDLSTASRSGGAASAITAAGSQIGPYSYTSSAFVRVPQVIDELLQVQPKQGHPMTRLTTAAAALSDFSFFRASSDANVFSKSEIWKPAVFDALSLVAKAAVSAAKIYRHTYADGVCSLPDPNLDFASNFSRMLGFHEPYHYELFRLYLLLHSDHEGGNVSSHASHIVGSALADPFASYAAGMAGLGGPLHGLANQKCLRWLRDSWAKLDGAKPTKEKVKKIAEATLESGQVIPGFGHAVLRVTDPRFTLQREFALKYIRDDPLFKFLDIVQEVVPEVLMAAGKVASPYPNVDCHSGVLLRAVGLEQERFYTVLFGVSRALGLASQFVWSRALHLPIERPKSINIENLERLIRSAHEKR